MLEKVQLGPEEAEQVEALMDATGWSESDVLRAVIVEGLKSIRERLQSDLEL